MNDRKLKKYRIIPRELYVERKADQQVANIIYDMESPGYVLVARQMGKTNLLLHAKEVLAQAGDTFAYIDLSNIYPTAKESFRNIVDTVLNSGDESLLGVKHIILDARKAKELAPHLEHQNELKLILDAIGGKLVIILDEIDALLRANYSDDIFKQIRSVYFEGRTNFPSFKRLTYLLSGVIEPSDLIKDPKISPFNIGEKIYLDDFTFNEFKGLANFSAIEISDDLLHHIFDWCDGNPRISYDLLSELEELVIKNEVDLSSKLVDELIRKRYLTSYDIPPIDHIRGLVQHDKDLRQAVTMIRYQKAKEISDKSKKKLYLSGITASPYTDDRLKIKNRIIDEAISEQWISQIEVAQERIDEIVQQKFSQKKFDECIVILEEHLSTGKGNVNQYYSLGLSYFYISDLKLALKNFELSVFDPQLDKSKALDVEFIKGLCYLKMKRYDDAAQQFKKTTEDKINENLTVYYNSLINLGTALFLRSNEQETTQLIWENAIMELDASLKENPNSELLLESYCNVHLNLAHLLMKKEQPVARRLFEKILHIGNLEQRLCIHVEYLDLLPDAEKTTVLNLCRQMLHQFHLDKIQRYDGTNLLGFNTYHLLIYFSHLDTVRQRSIIVSDLDKLLQVPWQDHSEREEFHHWIAEELIKKNKPDAASFYYKQYVDTRVKYRIHKDITFKNAVYNLLEQAANALEFESYLNYYEQYLRNTPANKYASVDFVIIFKACSYYFNNQEYERIIALCSRPIHMADVVQIESRFDLILALYWSLRAVVKLELNGQTGFYANQIFSIYNEFKNDLSTTIKNEEHIMQEILFLAGKYTSDPQVKPVPLSRKVSVRYNDGKVKSRVRFKLVENDLKTGKCVLI